MTNIKDLNKLLVFLIFGTVLSILFSAAHAQDEIYPRIISQSPESSARPNWANLYPILGSANETFSVTYSEANMTKVMLFWKAFYNVTYNNIILSGCNPGENQSCSINLDLSVYLDGTVIVYEFVIYDENSCSLDPWLAGYEEKCGNGYGLPKNCYKGFESFDESLMENCTYDMYGYPIIQGNLSMSPETDYLRHVKIQRTPSTTTTPTTTTIPLEERIENLEEKVAWLESLINSIKNAICNLHPFDGLSFCEEPGPPISTTTTTTPPITPKIWDHSTCYNVCLKKINVPYDPCNNYWAVRNIVDRGYCKFI